MWDCGGIIITPPPCRSRPCDSRSIDPGGGRWWRVTGYIRGVLPTIVEVSLVTGGKVTGKVTQPWKTQR